jgi:Ca2+-transporting ATPase
VKGGVEAVLARCTLTADGQAEVAAMVLAMAAQGQRVLTLAKKELPTGQEGITHGDVAAGLIFLGLQAMIDPPRAEAVAAVRICRAAGILVKMITGDHAVTAGAIARQVGLGNDGEEAAVATLSGQELDHLTDAELAQRVVETVVFARATPEQKLRLVMALQAQGHVVAMTGDGVNDAPALKRADIGVAMGITGTEVAKEAAAMVLADDNFSSIEAAVEEGRGVFDNLTKFIVWTLPTNLGEGLVILAAVLLGLTMPILPLQILWINMTTAGFLGLALAFEPKEPGIMQRQPRDPKAPILSPELLLRVGLVSGLMLVSAFLLFRWELAAGATLVTARTVAVNVFVVVELCYLLNCRSLSKGFFQLPLWGNPLVFAGILTMLAAQGLYTYTPVMNRLFQSTPINAAAWGRIAVAGVAVFALIEVEKMAWRLWRRGRK